MSISAQSLTRRAALRSLSSLAAGLLIASKSVLGQARQSDQSTNTVLPSDAGRKFNSDGTPRPFSGNTIVCPLDQRSQIWSQLSRLHSDWAKHPFAKNIALVPPSSYHMTVFSGANDQDRKAGLWPAGIPLNTPMKECNEIVERRILNAHLDVSLPLRFKIDADPEHQLLDGSAIRLLPFNDVENHKVRELRNRLSEAVQMRTPDHDAYRFHISLGYWVQVFSAAERADYLKTLLETVEILAASNQVLELNAPAYCTFQNMLAYKIERALFTNREASPVAKESSLRMPLGGLNGR